MGMKHRESCRPAFRKLKIVTLTSQYILSLMTLMVNNLEYFTFNYTIHNKLTRHGRNLHVPQSHLAMRQKGVYYRSAKIFNSLYDYLINLIHDKNQFIGEIKYILSHNPSYTIIEFLLLCQSLQQRKGKVK
jgi:hypothetical protein